MDDAFEAPRPMRTPVAADRGSAVHHARGETPEEMEFAPLLRSVWRRKLLVISTIFLITLFATVVAFQLTPRYSASAKILVGTPETNVVDIEAVLSGLGSDQAAVESEVQVLASRSLAGKVADELGLDRDPEFNARLRPPSILSAFDPLQWLPDGWRAALLGRNVDAAPPTQEEIEQRTRADVITALQEAVSVRVEGRSRVINISATSEQPKLAAAVANTLSDLYLVDQLEAKFEATKRATDWLNDRVQELRGQVAASEDAIEEYRRRTGLVQSKDTTVTQQQISEINTQLILARTQTAEAGARLTQMSSLVESAGGVDSAAEVLASSLIQRLREREADVARRVAEMSTEYGKRHPKMINTKAELDDIRSKIEAEVAKVVRGLENELEVARTRERTLERNLEQLKRESERIKSSEGQLRVLEREAAADRALFDTFLARLKETGQQDEIQQADARIISRADVPAGASSPNKKLIIAGAFALSAFLGVLLVFLLEHLDHGFRSSEQIENMTGASTLSLVPLLSAMRLRRSTPSDYVLNRPASAFAESLRTLHTGILLSGLDDAPKSVLITSSTPEEGKTTVATAMARLTARSGKKVLLLDGDLRRARIRSLLRLDGTRGLLDALGQHSPLEECIQHDEASGLHVLATGGNVPNPPEVLGSQQMAALMDTLERTYDMIIVDSPPVLVVSDARILSRLADRTVFITRWGETKRESVKLALKQLVESGANVAGVVLCMVNIRKHAQYGYADSTYYYESARRYYVD